MGVIFWIITNPLLSWWEELDFYFGDEDQSMLLQSSRENNTHLAYEEFCTLTWLTVVLCCQEAVLRAQMSNSSSLPGGYGRHPQTARQPAQEKKKGW